MSSVEVPTSSNPEEVISAPPELFPGPLAWFARQGKSGAQRLASCSVPATALFRLD